MKLFIAILALFFTGYSQAAIYDSCSCEVFQRTGAHLAVSYLKGTTVVKEDENDNMDSQVIELAQFTHHDKRHYFTPEVARSALELCQGSMKDHIKKDICPVNNTK